MKFNAKSWAVLAAMVVVPFAVVGCGGSGEESAVSGPSEEGRRFLLTEEPESAVTVIEARESAEDDESVTLVGRIGGSANPWVDGQASFSIVDPSLYACSDIPGDKCRKPWDYCCQTHLLPKSTVLVQVVDESGKPVDTDAKALLGVKELDTVVVRGRAERDEAGNLTVMATGLYVKPESEVVRPAFDPSKIEHHDDDDDEDHEHGEKGHGDAESSQG